MKTSTTHVVKAALLASMLAATCLVPAVAQPADTTGTTTTNDNDRDMDFDWGLLGLLGLLGLIPRKHKDVSVHRDDTTRSNINR